MERGADERSKGSAMLRRSLRCGEEDNIFRKKFDTCATGVVRLALQDISVM
jgi:hypothetical protein